MKAWVKTALYFLAAIVITACVSIAATITIMNSQRGDRMVLDAKEYTAYQSLLPIIELIEKIQTEHLGEEISEDKLIKGAMDGMLNSIGDPYARYYSEEEYVAYLEQLDGSYHGIGALVGQPQGNGVSVLKVYTKSPAEQAGLLTGDIITAVDGTDLQGLTLEEIEQLFTGKDGSSVTLSVQRQSQSLSLTMQRASGATQRVVHRLFNQRTGYIQIDKFTGTAAEECVEAVRDLTERGMRSLVIDLRNNPGGELQQVVTIANLLLKDTLIVTIRTANGKNDEYRADSRQVTVPLAILVNEHSASASEILAGAVKDTGRGLVVGTQTYGKGVVQSTMQLKSNRGWVKLTTAAYYTPNGLSVNGKGIEPDINVDLSEELKSLPINMIEQDDDAQLWAALDIVREQADELDAQNSSTLADIEENEAA